MKIVHVVEAWKGGIASYVEAMIKDQVARGYSVSLLADSEHLDKDSRELGVEVVGYTSSRNPLQCIRIARDIARELKRLAPDVVHCHSTFPGIYVRLFNHACKVVYTPHAWSFFKQDAGALVKLFYKSVEWLMSLRCDKIICMSLEEMKAARTIGLRVDKLSLVYTGIPTIPGGARELCMEEQGLPVRVGFFGRFDYQKGFDLLEGVAPLLNGNIELHLFGGAVCGAARDLDPRLIAHGWIDHETIHEHMLTMDIILIPSRWEGFALTPLEAMRARRPIITSNLSSLPEVVIHGFNGIVLYNYSKEGLAEILNSLTREDCFRMGENAIRVYEQSFMYSDFSERISAIYKN